MINVTNTFFSPVRSNTNYTMLRIGGASNANHYVIVNRSGDVVASGKRKHVIEVWSNVGTAQRPPMSASL